MLIDPAYGGDIDGLITELQDIAHNHYGVGHATIQIESSLDGCV